MQPLKKLNIGFNTDDENQKIFDSNNQQIATEVTNITSEEANRRIIQNFRLVWLDSSINENNNDDSINTTTKLQEIVNTIEKFTDVNQCVCFMTDIRDEQIFMICSGELGPTVIPLIHSISQINCIYILCQNKTWHEQWVKGWSKVQGIHTDITSICQALKQVVYECDQNLISISFISTSDDVSNQDLDTLDQSFMNTQLLKEILLTIEFKQSHINEFLSYCREQFVGNIKELRNIDKIEIEYHDHQPIWWYTCNCFLYSMLNRALRTMEVDLIVKMGFFIRDLHTHIAELHAEQYDEQDQSDSFTLYRGQGLSQADFDHLNNTQGGLLSFNNFLSTSTNRNVSLSFARRTIVTSDLVGILFVIEINPSISVTPFANVKDVSCFQREDEILFSMHSIFRIGQITQLDENNRLWQVDLILTSDTDPQLYAVTKSIHDETEGTTGWHSLGKLMIQLGHFNKAEELYDTLLKQTKNEHESSFLFYQLGWIKDSQGKYAEAVEFYANSINIIEKLPSENDADLAASYNNIGEAYENMGEYSKALSYSEKALTIHQKSLPANHPDLATSYNNIGGVYISKGEYSKALSFQEKALEIYQKTLPKNHPNLAASYNNIGELYQSMGEYSKALSYYEKELEITQDTLSENHPDLASAYNNIGRVYGKMGEYSKALSYCEKALAIHQKSLPENHPDLATSYNNIGLVYRNMGEYLKAVLFQEKALEIQQKSLPENHPYLATSYSNISLVYTNIGEYSKALSYCEKALEIQQKSLPENHPSLATSYNNIGLVYKNMSVYSKALLYYEKALEIYRKTLSENHPNLAVSYNNIGGVYESTGEYSKALSYCEKVLEIRQKSLPENHPSLATSYNNIGWVCNNTGEYSKALFYYERALYIRQHSLPPDHPDIKNIKESIEIVKKKL